MDGWMLVVYLLNGKVTKYQNGNAITYFDETDVMLPTALDRERMQWLFV